MHHEPLSYRRDRGRNIGLRYHLRTRVSSDYLRWLSEGAQESATHAVAISKTRLPGDDVDRMAALLHHQARSLDSVAGVRLRI